MVVTTTQMNGIICFPCSIEATSRCDFYYSLNSNLHSFIVFRAATQSSEACNNISTVVPWDIRMVSLGLSGCRPKKHGSNRGTYRIVLVVTFDIAIWRLMPLLYGVL